MKKVVEITGATIKDLKLFESGAVGSIELCQNEITVDKYGNVLCQNFTICTAIKQDKKYKLTVYSNYSSEKSAEYEYPEEITGAIRAIIDI